MKNKASTVMACSQKVRRCSPPTVWLTVQALAGAFPSDNVPWRTRNSAASRRALS